MVRRSGELVARGALPLATAGMLFAIGAAGFALTAPFASDHTPLAPVPSTIDLRFVLAAPQSSSVGISGGVVLPEYLETLATAPETTEVAEPVEAPVRLAVAAQAPAPFVPAPVPGGAAAASADEEALAPLPSPSPTPTPVRSIVTTGTIATSKAAGDDSERSDDDREGTGEREIAAVSGNSGRFSSIGARSGSH